MDSTADDPGLAYAAQSLVSLARPLTARLKPGPIERYALSHAHGTLRQKALVKAETAAARSGHPKQAGGWRWLSLFVGSEDGAERLRSIW